MDMFENIRARSELKKAEMERDTAKAKRDAAAYEAQLGTLGRYTNSGYSHSGATKSANWSKAYHYESLSAESDIEKNRKTLRERTRDLFMNSPVGAAAINTVRTNVIGSGLIPRPKIDYEFLGLSREYAESLQTRIKKEFALWAEGTFCDINDLNNFYELQQIAMLDWLKNGEEFILISYDKERPYTPYQLRLKLIEADRVCSPGSMNSDYMGVHQINRDNNNRIMNGIEINENGRVEAYYICSTHPGEDSFGLKREWKRIPKRGEKTGNPNVLHIMNAERADQYRGVPFLSTVIESLKQLTKYTEAEIDAAVINAMLTLFVTTEFGEGINGFGGVDEETGEEEEEIKLGTGTVNFLRDGEKIQPIESTHPNGGFDKFMVAICNLIGAALEIAPEVLLKKFSNNYSASKGALNETWKAFQMRRKWFVNDFCQVIYELWFAEAVSKGRINAPGFFNDLLIRRAYTNTTWNGPAQGSMDPTKDVNAAILKVENGFSTHEDECAILNGSDFEENVRILGNENEKLHEANAVLTEDTDEGNSDQGNNSW